MGSDYGPKQGSGGKGTGEVYSICTWRQRFDGGRVENWNRKRRVYMLCLPPPLPTYPVVVILASSLT